MLCSAAAHAATLRAAPHRHAVRTGVRVSRAAMHAMLRRADLPPHYKVTLTVDLSQRTERQQGIEIRPGMQATVELYTGEKTVLQYLTKPLYRGSEALREP